MWEIKKTVKKGDYLYGVCREHPNATKHGYVLLHRLIAENKIGRLLENEEIVHHKNEDKKNNDPSNLEVMGLRDHCRLHASTGRTVLQLVCPNCNKQFSREKRQLKHGTTPKCSRKCNGEYSRKLQLLSITQ